MSTLYNIVANPIDHGEMIRWAIKRMPKIENYLQQDTLAWLKDPPEFSFPVFWYIAYNCNDMRLGIDQLYERYTSGPAEQMEPEAIEVYRALLEMLTLMYVYKGYGSEGLPYTTAGIERASDDYKKNTPLCGLELDKEGS